MHIRRTAPIKLYGCICLQLSIDLIIGFMRVLFRLKVYRMDSHRCVTLGFKEEFYNVMV